MAENPNGAAPPSASSAPRLVVGIGASAGGIEALASFFAHVPSSSGAAYVVILHLSPDHDSRLAEVLQRTAAIPVTQVTERVTIGADHVYVVPPNKVLSIDQESIVVSEVRRPEQRRSPVDLFFRSLADAQASAAVAVVLSGTGPNGSGGLKRVKEYGGVTFAQDPDEAAHGDMPRNAIATGLVDFVLPVAQIPAKIVAYQSRISDASRGRALRPTPDVDALRDVLGILRMRTGHDFSNYKPGTVQRRVERRMDLLGLPSLHAYAAAIRHNPSEPAALMRDLLISVTHFFRDAPAFEALADRVIPRLFLDRTWQHQIRVWVPACATGEEAYSIAILLAEHGAKSVDQPGVQIFATDLDERAIATARQAVYTDAELVDLSEERLQRFFTRVSGGYRVRREIRETVLFAHHNVLRDPPFSHLNLISCRNLLIYLNRSVQERLVETFHFALRPGGYLLLGSSESPDGALDLFAPVDKTARIFESRGAAIRMPALRDPSRILPPAPARIPDVRPHERISPGELHQQLLERYAPPSLIVTEEGNIVHVSDRAGRYLQVTGGELTRDLLRLLRPELRPAVRSAIRQALRERAVVDSRDVIVTFDGGSHRVDVTVHPVLRDGDPPHGYLLITFDDKGERPTADPRHEATPPEAAATQLEEELAGLRLQLRRTIEQYETQVEEAKASNEELQAMNEELRSSAEELETSKEELQSVNEELTTVNQELKIKIEELGLANNDFQNLINWSDVGTIFLDRDLRVKLSTPVASSVFNLLKTDVGRPLSDITSHLRYEHLYADARQVLTDLKTVDREIETLDGRWTAMRIRPYRTTDDRIDGVVITFQDITERRQAEERMRQGEERLRLLIDSAIDYAIFTMGTDGIVDSWNPGADRMFGYRAEEIVGQHVRILFTPEDREARVPERELSEAQATGRAADDRFHTRKDGSRFFCSGITMRLGKGLGFAKIARDLTAQQKAAAGLVSAEAEFQARIRQRTDELQSEMRARAEAHQHVTDLLKRLVTAQEDERARIARDLHDQLGQHLTALRLSLQRHRDGLAAGQASPEDIERALTLADRLNRDLDFLSWELRPAVLDDLGLAAALPLFVREWSEHYRIRAEYQGTGYASGALNRDAEVAFYRVAQEALNNVTKHAHASRVDVLLEARDGAVTLVVEDDGVGFDPADKAAHDKGIGLAGMQERASLVGAMLQIESAPGEGTSIFLRCASELGAQAAR